jgi:hypothetical protein
MKLTRQIVRDARKKWHYIYKNNGSNHGLFMKYPELRKYIAGCSFCEVFLINNCKECPLNLVKEILFTSEGGNCNNPGHPYYKWNTDSTRENAYKMYRLVIDKTCDKV